MAALYLHNAIFIPDTPPDERSPHSRTLSSATYQTLPSDSHHTTEPLLHSESLAQNEPDSRGQALPDGNHLDWAMRHNSDDDPSALERKGAWEMSVRRRLRRLKTSTVVIELIMGIWTVYNAVRYFIAYSIYTSTEGQAFSLALGTSSLVSFAYLIFANALNLFESYLVLQNIPIRYLLFTQILFFSLASFFLIAPAIVNFILVFHFRSDDDSELNIASHCNQDVDVIWAVTRSSCPVPSWSPWLILSVVRLLLTFALIVAFHLSITSYQHTRRPSHTMTPRPRRRREKFPRTNTMSTSNAPLTVNSPHFSQSSGSFVTQSYHSYSNRMRSPASSQVAAQVSRTASEAPSHQSHSSAASHSHSQSSPTQGSPTPFHPTQINASTPPAAEFIDPEEFPTVAHALRVANSGSSPEPETPPIDGDGELTSFVDRFRSLVNQVQRETEDAIQFARPEIGATQPESLIGFDEFGRPYRAEDTFRFLNGYVRRMPTIESLGSREMGSIGPSSLRGATSSEWERDRLERVQVSRPGTQLTMATTTTTDYGQVIDRSDPPSRTSSIHWTIGTGTTGTPNTGFAELSEHVTTTVPPIDTNVMVPGQPVVGTPRKGSVSSSSNSNSNSTETTQSSRPSFHTTGSGPSFVSGRMQASPTEMSPVSPA